MSDLTKVISLLKNELTVDVYSGEIPEQQEDPAVLVQNIANPFERVLSGKKVKKYSVWRITVVAKLQSDVESTLEQLEDMDATSNSDFQRIFTNLVSTELGSVEQPFRRAFYNLTVYKR